MLPCGFMLSMLKDVKVNMGTQARDRGSVLCGTTAYRWLRAPGTVGLEWAYEGDLVK